MPPRRRQNDSDDELILGTPLETQEKKFVPVWKQEAVDERGRKRFHGAFTGGFSAGYYNTVGSKQGFTPATFVSSRNQRVNRNEQRKEDFMDEQDLREFTGGRNLTTIGDFKKKTEVEGDHWLKGQVLDDIISPSASSIGRVLLKKMGWKENDNESPVTRLLMELEKKQKRLEPLTETKKKPMQGFGVGVLEEEDEDIYGEDDKFESKFIVEEEMEKKVDKSDLKFEPKTKLEPRKPPNLSGLSGFIFVSFFDETSKWFDPPEIPSDYTPKQRTKSKVQGEKKRLTPNERGMILGEEQIMESKRIFQESNQLNPSRHVVDPRIALSALQGFKPFQDSKQSRYEIFLSKNAGLNNDEDLVFPVEFTEADKERELNEFVQAAFVFRPLMNSLADRFAPAKAKELTSETVKGGLSAPESLAEPTHTPKLSLDEQEKVLRDYVVKGRMGVMTRIITKWVPERMLCKRLSIADPFPDEVGVMSGAKIGVKSILDADTLAVLMNEHQQSQRLLSSLKDKNDTAEDQVMEQESEEEEEIAPVKKPGMELFKSIFEDFDNEEDEEIEETEEIIVEKEKPKSSFIDELFPVNERSNPEFPAKTRESIERSKELLTEQDLEKVRKRERKERRRAEKREKRREEKSEKRKEDKNEKRREEKSERKRKTIIVEEPSGDGEHSFLLQIPKKVRPRASELW